MREIDIILKPLFNSCGFSLKRTSWYRLTDDFIQIINFQKSHFSNLYYLNIGLDCKNGGYIIYKPEYKFPVRLRADMIISDPELIKYLDFDSVYPESVRTEKLKIIALLCVQFLDSIADWQQFKSAFNDKDHLIHQAFIISSFLSLL